MKNLKKFFAFSIATAMVAGAVWAGTPGFQALASSLKYWYDPVTKEYTEANTTGNYTQVWYLGESKYTYADVSKFSISPTANEVNINNTLKLTVVCSDTAIGTNFTTKWSSTDLNIAKISSTGEVTGISDGTVRIQCEVLIENNDPIVLPDKQITVIDPKKIQSVEIDDDSLVLRPGEIYPVSVTVLPSTASEKVVWSSSDESVVEIRNGEVYAHKPGTATITVASESNSERRDSIGIEVADNVVDVSITPKDLTLYVGEYGEATATLKSKSSLIGIEDFTDVPTDSISFKSSDESVAHVSGMSKDNGNLKLEIGGYKPGTASISLDVAEDYSRYFKVNSDEIKVTVLTESSTTDPNAPTSEDRAKQEQTPESIENYQNWLATYGGGAATTAGTTAVSGTVGQPGSEAIVNTASGEPVTMFQSNDATNTLLAAPVGVVPSGTKIETVEAGKDTPAFKAVQNKLSRISRRGTVQKVYGIAGLNPDGSLMTLINGKAAMSMPMPTDITVPAGRSLKVYLIDDNGQTTKLDTAVDQGRVVFEIPKFGTFAFVVE